MIKMCAQGPTISGIDVSRYQNNINWNTEKLADHVQFAWAKASQGVSEVDPLFVAHRAGIKAAALAFGAYHFFNPSEDPVVQATHFVNTVAVLAPGDKLAIDWETADGMPTAQDRMNGLIFLQTVHQLTGIPAQKLWIYGPPHFLQALGLDARFAEYRLWVAHYGVVCPLIPPPWTTFGIHQYSQANGIDSDRFNGTIEQYLS